MSLDQRVQDCNSGSLAAHGVPVPRFHDAASTFAAGAVEIVVARANAAAETVRDSAALLSDREHKRASRFVFERDRRRFIIARARLRRLLSARLSIRPEAIELVYGTHGKPAIAPHCNAADLHFNMSHSGGVVAYAFSSGREIGIDIERVRTLDAADDIAARFFSRREHEAYVALDAPERSLGFFHCWTRKEAFVKALGDGLTHPLNRFDVSLAPCEPAQILRVDGVPGERCGWTLHGFIPSPDFVGAVVVRARPSGRSRR